MWCIHSVYTTGASGDSAPELTETEFLCWPAWQSRTRPLGIWPPEGGRPVSNLEIVAWPRGADTSRRTACTWLPSWLWREPRRARAMLPGSWYLLTVLDPVTLKRLRRTDSMICHLSLKSQLLLEFVVVVVGHCDSYRLHHDPISVTVMTGLKANFDRATLVRWNSHPCWNSSLRDHFWEVIISQMPELCCCCCLWMLSNEMRWMWSELVKHFRCCPLEIRVIRWNRGGLVSHLLVILDQQIVLFKARNTPPVKNKTAKKKKKQCQKEQKRIWFCQWEFVHFIKLICSPYMNAKSNKPQGVNPQIFYTPSCILSMHEVEWHAVPSRNLFEQFLSQKIPFQPYHSIGRICIY